MKKFKQAVAILLAVLGIIAFYGIAMYVDAWFMSWRIEYFGF